MTTPARRDLLKAVAATAALASGGAWAAEAGPTVEPGSAGLFTALSRRAIPFDAAHVVTIGFRQPGVGGARYRRVPASETLGDWGRDLWWVAGRDGIRWALDEPRPSSDMFGCAKDAACGLDGIISGTDDTARLNALLRYAEEVGTGVAILSTGSHRVSDTLRVGQGRTFVHMVLVGEVPGPWPTLHDGQKSFPSAMLIADRNDRPCINVQGARNGVIRDIVVYGPLRTHILTRYLGRSDDSPVLEDDSAVAAWEPGGSIHGHDRYSPGCGFAVDAWSGAQPAGGYPGARYGQPPSSGVTFDGCQVAGFSVAFAVKPSDDDANGDFVRIRDCGFTECVFGLSVGNSQARNLEVANLKGAHFHTAFTNRRHGRQSGRFGGPIANCSFGQAIQLFDLATARTGGFRMTDAYGEGIWRLGTAVGEGLVEISGDFLLAGANAVGGGMPTWAFPARGLPTTHFAGDDDGVTASRLELRGPIQVATGLVIRAPFFSYDGQMVVSRQAALAATGPVPRWRAAAHNAAAGGLLLHRTIGVRADLRPASSFLLYDIDTGRAADQANWDGRVWGDSRRRFGCPAYARALQQAGDAVEVTMPPGPSALGGGQVASARVQGSELVLGLRVPSVLPALHVGALIHHLPSGLWGAIRSVTPARDGLIADLFNGFALDRGGWVSWPRGVPEVGSGEYALWSGNYHVSPEAGDEALGDSAGTTKKLGRRRDLAG